MVLQANDAGMLHGQIDQHGSRIDLDLLIW